MVPFTNIIYLNVNSKHSQNFTNWTLSKNFIDMEAIDDP